MRNSVDIANELNDKVYEVLRRGYERKELTVLMPIRDYDKLLLINDTIVYNHVIRSGDAEVITVVGVTVKPVKDLDKIYVCL